MKLYLSDLKAEFVPRSKHSTLVIKPKKLMLCSEVMAVCSEIHTKHINTLCGQNVELLNVELAVHIATTGPKVNSELKNIPCLLFYTVGSVICLLKLYMYRTARCVTANPLTISLMQHRKTHKSRRGGFVQESRRDVNAVDTERLHLVPLYAA
jgi:hypothetical protein